MCLFRKKKVTDKKYQSVSTSSEVAKDFFTLLDEKIQESKEKQSQAKNCKGSLGGDFYSILDEIKMGAPRANIKQSTRD